MRLVFIGSGAIGIPSLNALLASAHEVVGVVTQPDRPVGRHQTVQAGPVKSWLNQHLRRAKPPVLLLQPERIKDQVVVDQVSDLQPDIIVVAAYGQILPNALLRIPTSACLNIHASLLPRWRGAAPIQAAIAAGDLETGITIMYVDEGLDTGDILIQHVVPILPNETGGSLHDHLAAAAPDPLLESLRLLSAGGAPRRPQDNSFATYAPKLTRQDGLIDCRQPAEAIERKVRAYNPWPGAFIKINKQQFKIFAVRVVEETLSPGKIVPRGGEILLGAADGAVSLTDVQLEGKRRMSAAEFLRGHSQLLGP